MHCAETCGCYNDSMTSVTRHTHTWWVVRDELRSSHAAKWLTLTQNNSVTISKKKWHTKYSLNSSKEVTIQLPRELSICHPWIPQWRWKLIPDLRCCRLEASVTEMHGYVLYHEDLSWGRPVVWPPKTPSHVRAHQLPFMLEQPGW